MAIFISSAALSRPAETSPARYEFGNTITSDQSLLPVPNKYLTFTMTSSSGQIKRVRMYKDREVTESAYFRLHLYSDIPADISSDRVAWLTGSVDKYIGYVDIAASEQFGTSSTPSSAAGIGIPAGCGIPYSSSTLYGVIEVRGEYLPKSAEAFTFILEGVS